MNFPGHDAVEQDVGEMTTNNYDKNDIIRRRNFMRAGPVKLAAYTVLDMETGEHGKQQFHFTYGDTVLAVMSEDSARLFAWFVADALHETFECRKP